MKKSNKIFTFEDLVNIKIQNKDFNQPSGTLASKIEAIQYIKQVKKMKYKNKEINLKTFAELHNVQETSIFDFLTSVTTKD